MSHYLHLESGGLRVSPNGAVSPDLRKFRQVGNILKVFDMCLRVYLVLDEILKLRLIIL